MARFHTSFKKWLTKSFRSKPTATAVKVGVVQLEDRSTPATANLVDGTLTVDFTAANDVVTFNTTATEAVLTGSGFKVTGEKFDLAKVHRVVLNDTVNLGGQQITFTGKTLALANGLKSTGVDTVLVSVAPITVTGDAGIDITAPSRIEFLNSAITTGAGGLRLVANGEGFTNAFNAVATSVSLIGGSVTTTGAGSVNFQGTALGTPVPVGQSDISRTAIGVLVNSDITTSGGDITLNGTTTAVPDGFVSTDRLNGVILTGKLLPGGNGSVFITGKVGAGATGIEQRGVDIDALVTLTGTGKVEINGTAGGGAGSSGVLLRPDSSITAAGGDITIIGAGSPRSTGEENRGITVDEFDITNTGSGNITLRGTSGEGLNKNQGALVDGSELTVVDGTITIEGQSIATLPGNQNHGVSLTGFERLLVNGREFVGTIQATGSGSVIVIGRGGSQLANGTPGGPQNNPNGRNAGVAAQTQIATKTGAITLTGTGGQGIASNFGVWVTNKLSSDSGAITLTGTGGGQAGQVDNVGVLFEGSPNLSNQMVTTNTGSVTLNGKGQVGSHGVHLAGGSVFSKGGAIRVNTDSFKNLSRFSSVTPGSNLISNGGTVTIAPVTAGTKISLGGDDILTGDTLALGLSASEFGQLVGANQKEALVGEQGELLADVAIGNATTGNIVVSNDVTFTRIVGSKNVILHTSGNVSHAPPAIGAIYTQFTQSPLQAPGNSPLKVIGGIDLTNNVLQVNITGVPAGTKYTLVDNDGTDPVLGTFTNFPLPEFGGLPFSVTYTGGDGNDVVLTVLEPTSPRLPSGPILFPRSGVNNAPTIDPISDIQNPTSAPFLVTVPVSDVETPIDQLVLTVTSSNESLVPLSAIQLNDFMSVRSAFIRPVEGVTGSSTITFTVTDRDGATGSESFNLTVGDSVPPTTPPVVPPTVPPRVFGQPPTISEIPTQTSMNSVPLVVPFTIGDDVTPVEQLTIEAVVNGTRILPNENVVITGTGANRTMTLTPVRGEFGSVTVQLRVVEFGELNSTTRFVDFQFDPIPGSPTITSSSNGSTFPAAGVVERGFDFTVSDAQTPVDQLTLTATSSNQAIVTNDSIRLVSAPNGERAVLFTDTGRAGTTILTVTVTDSDGLTHLKDFTINATTLQDPTVPPEVPPTTPPVVPPVAPPTTPPVVLNGPGVITATAERGSSTVNVYNADGMPRLSVNPFGAIAAPIRTATGDFNNDGVEDLVVGTGAGMSARVSVFDGKTQQELFTFEPYESTFRGGVFVATGDQNNDGFADLIVTPDAGGGPRVRVVRFTANGGTPTVDFFGIDDPNFRGGARAAMGDVNGDGQSELIVAAGNGGGPRIAVYDGAQLGGNGGPKLVNDFFAFEETLRNGAYISAGDVNGDGKSDLVFGGGPGGGPRVLVIDGSSLMTTGSENLVPVANFFAGNANDRDGVRVVVKDLDGDRFADIVAGTNTRLKAFTGVSSLASSQPATTLDFTVFPELSESVFVG